MNFLFIRILIFLALYPALLCAQTPVERIQIAFLADVHFQDLYGTLKDNPYQGVLNPKNGKFTFLRTMDAQLRSTRIFNENYFAFYAALNDIVKRGIKFVALPGDYTDDGQALHLRGLQRILKEYNQKYGIKFFITTGNHDPVGPFLKDAGKDDFLGKNGMRQAVYSKQDLFKPSGDNILPPLITQDIAQSGYSEILDYLKDFGFFPKKEFLFWSTPFSSYNLNDYSFEKAAQSAGLEKRQYDVAPGYSVPDVSYVVEPVKGLWLLAIDGNTYIPKTGGNDDPADPTNYSGADLGYNNVLSNKRHLLSWVKKVADEAKKQNKTLVAFSHYPMVEFNDDASSEIAELMGAGKWQLSRVPQKEVAQIFADAGVKIHFGGHMHINDTGIHTTKSGNTLVNIQTPSLAAYIPAYKLLSINANQVAEIQTIVLNDVPGFDALFGLYEIEYAYLQGQAKPDIWNKAILKTTSYRDFTSFHLKELVRLRFFPQDWPAAFKDSLLAVLGDDLLAIGKIKDKDAFVSGLIFDFYRLHSADRLAIADIGEDKIKQYEVLSAAFIKKNKYLKNYNREQKHLLLFFQILDKFLKGAPADHFQVDLRTGSVKELK